MKINFINKSKLTKLVMASTMILPLSGLLTYTAQAAIVPNTKTICHVTKATKVYNSYKKHKHATGQILPANSSWRIIKTAKTKKNATWYDLGKNQWIKAPKAVHYTQVTQTPVATKTASVSYQAAQTAQTVQATPIQAVSQAPHSNVVNTQTPKYNLAPISYKTVKTYKPHYNASSNANSSANYIAGRESGGSYSARNGQYIGKYQLSASYLHGDYSPANQERVARQYAISRYGSWANAANFHRTHGWW